MKELNFIKTDINQLKYGNAKEIIGRQGTEDRERPDDTIIIFEAIAKSIPEKTKEGMLSGEAWCRAYILCDCGGTHLIRSDKTIGEQMKHVFDDYPNYFTRLINENQKALIANFLYQVDPADSEHGISMFSFRKPDGRIECSMCFDSARISEEQIEGFINKLQEMGADITYESDESDESNVQKTKPKSKRAKKK